MEAIEKMLAEIAGLMDGIRKVGEVGRTKLTVIETSYKEISEKDPFDSGTLDQAKWDQLDDSAKEELQTKLKTILDSLSAIGVADGPPEPNHIMYGVYASNGAVWLCLCFAFVITLAIISQVFSRWSEATGTDNGPKVQAAWGALQALEGAKEAEGDALKARATAMDTVNKAESDLENAGTDAAAKNKATAALEKAKEEKETADKKFAEAELLSAKAKENADGVSVQAVQAILSGGPTEQSVLIMVILMGALGGCLHLISSLVKFVGNRELMRSWLPYYVFIPIKAAGLAPIVYMLLRVGILSPSGTGSDGSATSNLNLVSIYAFAGLTGLFAKTALEKLHEVFTTLFRSKTSAKNQLSDEKPPGSPAGKEAKS